MEREKDTLVMEVVARPRFEDHDVVVVEYGGRQLWSARQVAEALDYSRADRLVSRIAEEWSDELAEDIDYVVFRGEDLAALKSAVPDLVDARAPALLMLTESGVHLVSLLSRQPAAKRLRRWLASEVLPAIRKTGFYTHPGRAAPTVADLGSLPSELLALPGGVLLDLLFAEGALGRALPAMRSALAASSLTQSSSLLAVRRKAAVDALKASSWSRALRVTIGFFEEHCENGRWNGDIEYIAHFLAYSPNTLSRVIRELKAAELLQSSREGFICLWLLPDVGGAGGAA